MSGRRRSEALAAALFLLHEPHLVRLARSHPLPPGMTFLLEVAAGDIAAITGASRATGRSGATIGRAAGFFIEQVLFAPQTDSYRLLGANSESPDAELRRHMALLMRWLHPDLTVQGGTDRRFDKSAFASRITAAWDCLKTAERRAVYDASLCAGSGAQSETPPRNSRLRGTVRYRVNLRRDWRPGRLLPNRAWR